MKNLIYTTLISLGLLTAAAQAGEATVSAGKASKNYVEETCFKAQEWQFDVFGQYSVGEAFHAGLFHDHAFGGGVGINYFFTRNLGLGVDAAWLDVKEDPRFAETPRFTRRHSEHETTTMHNFTGSVIYRFPIDEKCLAPYIYAGGGCHVDGQQWASAHAGVGLEYRIKPEKFGVFLDARWTYLGDREGRDDLNFFSTRAGFRFIF
jgi:hypothetical protein